MDLLNLNSFLKMGYFLKYQNPTYKIDVSGANKALYRDWKEDDLIHMGIQLFREAIDADFETNRMHVVPISGGYDSRAILSMLLEFTEARNISTYTFGTPGTFDYDIGNLVAMKAGTQHTTFPMTEYLYTMDELLDLSKRFQHQTALFFHPPVWEIDKRFKDHVIWSGYVGGPTTGSATPKNPVVRLEDAKDHFLNRAPIRSDMLLNCPRSDLFPLIDWDGFDNNHLSFEEQLDFRNRQSKYIAPQLLYPEYEYKTPFLYPAFFNFMLSLPDTYRRGQYLYGEMFLQHFPNLFLLRTKKTGGLPLKAGRFRKKSRIIRIRIQKEISKTLPMVVNPSINYLDFDWCIRKRNDLKKIVYDNIMDLKARKLIDWVDLETLWKEHMEKRNNHAAALMILASVEIHLKAGLVLS